MLFQTIQMTNILYLLRFIFFLNFVVQDIVVLAWIVFKPACFKVVIVYAYCFIF